MGKYAIHSDLKKYEKTKIPLSPVALPLLNALTGLGFSAAKPVDGVSETKVSIAGEQGLEISDGEQGSAGDFTGHGSNSPDTSKSHTTNRKNEIELIIFEPDTTLYAEKPASPHAAQTSPPCLVYLHGGAFAMKAAPHHKRLLCEYAAQTPCKLVFVDYRLAPKHPFPVGVEDCYAAFQWVVAHAAELNIDPARIAIGGDSAGGALAAAVTLMARDRRTPEPCAQMLLYPVTDARQISESIKRFSDTPLWNSKLNKKMWELYLKNGFPIAKEYASPMETVSLKNLPEAYVEVCEFDCLRDEGIQYAEGLAKAGGSVELHETNGTIHGFEIAEKSILVQEALVRRVNFLRRIFGVRE